MTDKVCGQKQRIYGGSVHFKDKIPVTLLFSLQKLLLLILQHFGFQRKIVYLGGL